MLSALRRLLDGQPPARAPAPARLPLDLRDPQFMQDPYPTFDWLRVNDPVHRTADGAWMLTRYADVEAALTDRRLGSAPARHALLHARNRPSCVAADVAANILPFQDPPAHTGPRRAINRVFQEQLRAAPPDARGLAAELLEQCAGQEEMDVLEDFATPLSLRVMSGFMGLPVADITRLKAWSEHFFYLFAPMPSEQVLQAVDCSLRDYRQYFMDQIAQRRRHPDSGFISALVAGGGELPEVVMADTCMLLFSDGIENVDAAIASSVLSLLGQRAQWDWLVRHPQQLGAAVEECLRHESPAQFIARVAAEDVELHGRHVSADSAVLLMLGAANRDPQRFVRPERLDIRRQGAAPLGFGRGHHSCIGARLAKLQIEAALDALLRRFPRLALTRARVAWRDRLGHRWWRHLPVILHGR